MIGGSKFASEPLTEPTRPVVMLFGEIVLVPAVFGQDDTIYVVVVPETASSLTKS